MALHFLFFYMDDILVYLTLLRKSKPQSELSGGQFGELIHNS